MLKKAASRKVRKKKLDYFQNRMVITLSFGLPDFSDFRTTSIHIIVQERIIITDLRFAFIIRQ
jgi:hypothetical protein